MFVPGGNPTRDLVLRTRELPSNHCCSALTVLGMLRYIENRYIYRYIFRRYIDLYRYIFRRYIDLYRYISRRYIDIFATHLHP
jgi:hypothetical protein